MNFKQFLRETGHIVGDPKGSGNSSTATGMFFQQAAGVGSAEPRQGSAYNTTGTFVPGAATSSNFGQSPVAPKLNALHNALKLLDPFIGKRGNGGYMLGTIDYMAPEQGKQSSQTDHDNVTHFYLSIRQHHPQAANLMKPIVPLFKQFIQTVMGAMEGANRGGVQEAMNAEMVFRLDKKLCADITKGADQVNNAISQFTAQEIQQIGPKMQQAVQLFQKFYAAFKNVIPQIQQYIDHAYSQVQHQAWDYTKGQ